MEKYCVLDKESEELLKLAILELDISARAYDKILRVSRTIVDLDASKLSKRIIYRKQSHTGV